MLPTPSTSHVDFNRIYEPAEDSYLLLDTLSSDTETAFLHAQFPADSPSPLVLEVGAGSGVVLAFVTAHAERIIGRSDAFTLGTDMNRFACGASVETVRVAVDQCIDVEGRAASFLGCLNGDLATMTKPGSVDVLIFNPPYVPSEAVPSPLHYSEGCDSKDTFSRDSSLLFLSTDGGYDGMEITDRLLLQLPFLLSQRGVAYILLCAQNKPEEVISRICSWHSSNHSSQWKAEKVGSSGKKAGWERLCIIRIWRQTVDGQAVPGQLG